MPFVKLDTKILDSTLWVERESREVFITALLMAEPIELREPAEALKVQSIEPLGFTVPPGWYGFVPAAGLGIVRRAMVPQEAGLLALENLSSPDSASRSMEHEGRRMVRVDGGYLILNYMKYRERDYTAAERQRRLRERKRASVTRDVSTVTPQHHGASHIADADAETDAEIREEKKNPSPTKPTLGSIEFQTFWDSYPRKVAKLDALKAWVKGACDGKLGEILAGLESWKRTEQWGDVEKIPYPATFLNGKRWQETPQKGVTKNEQKGERTKRAIERVRAELAGEAG